MKKFLSVMILLVLLAVTIIYQKEISSYVIVNFIYKRDIVVEDPNQYKLSYNFHYLSKTDNFVPKNENELINVIYTILNNGWDTFTFYCDTEYKSCIDDVDVLSKNSALLSTLNNFVHPFNSYNVLYMNYNDLGRVTINIDKTYHDNEIEILESKVNEIYNNLITDNMTIRDKILAIHDYIINKTTYDTERAAAITSNDYSYIPLYQSHKALGPLIQKMGICGGYSDSMALFLIKLGIPNYKISNADHIWNYVYLDNAWYHLDLTWDDPVASNKKNLLIHDYFLITTDKLFSLKNNHQFKENIFMEAALNKNV
ncbi:MAG: transglutaminase domain-containing protein [Bacilli bacterium]